MMVKGRVRTVTVSGIDLLLPAMAKIAAMTQTGPQTQRQRIAFGKNHAI
jgi:hypothetical protein